MGWALTAHGKVAVIVVEDASAAYAGIAHLLRAERLRIGACSGAGSSRAMHGCRCYDVALLEVHLGAHSALGVAEDMPRRDRDSPVAPFTEDVGAEVIFAEALRMGARGFVMSGSSRLRFAQPRDAEFDGIERWRACAPPRTQSESAMQLDSVEYDVLGLLASGLNRGAVARQLALTPDTVQVCTRTGSTKLAATMPARTVAALVRNRGWGRTPVLVSS